MPKISAVFFLFFCIPVYGFQVSGAEWVIVEENKELRVPDELKNRLRSSGSPGDIKQAFRAYYFSEGYFNVQVDSVNVIQKRAFIQKNERFRFGRIEVKAEGFDYGISTGGFFSVERLQNENQRLVAHYENKGYPLVEVQIRKIEPDYSSHTVDVAIGVDAGERWFAEELLLTPTRKVGQDFVMMASGYRDSLLITPQNLREIRRNINNTGYFDEVGEPELLVKDGKKTIFIPLTERNPNFFDGLVGFVPTPDNRSQIVGEAELGLANAFTDGSMINFAFQRLNPEESRLNIGYEQFFIAGLPLDISGSFMFFQQDTNYQQRQFELEGRYRATSSLSLTGSVNLNSVTANDDVPGFTEIDGESNVGFFGFEYNTLNHPFVSTSGLNLSVSFGLGTKRVSLDDSGLGVGDERIRQRILKGSAGWYLPFRPNQVFLVEGNFYFMDAGQFTLSDLIRFGGANSFRGYEEEQFQASRMGWGNVEYRYLVNRNSYLFGFATAGGYHRPELITDINQQLKKTEFLYSSGFGLSYRTAVGQLRFSYALSPQQDLGNGKIHFGIVTSI